MDFDNPDSQRQHFPSGSYIAPDFEAEASARLSRFLDLQDGSFPLPLPCEQHESNTEPGR